MCKAQYLILFIYFPSSKSLPLLYLVALTWNTECQTETGAYCCFWGVFLAFCSTSDSFSPSHSCKQEILKCPCAVLNEYVLGSQLFSVWDKTTHVLEGEDGFWFLGRGQFIPLFLVCYFALLMSKCNKLWIVPVTLAGSSQWPQMVLRGGEGWGIFSNLTKQK